MNFKDFIKRLQTLMNEKGAKLTVDGDPGPKTQAEMLNYEIDIEVARIQVPVVTSPPLVPHTENPAYLEAKKYEGQGEKNPGFVALMVSKAKKVGLPYFKTLLGASFAWCSFFVVVMNSDVGQKYVSSGMAKDQSKYGVAVDWKVNGIPKGAVIHINHNADCKSESNNHVTFADGDCTPEDLSKPGAQWPGFGGNQADQVKRSMYPVAHICEVRWPTELPKPGRITKSIGCSGPNQGKESTQ
jgi:hypothetical protein